MVKSNQINKVFYAESYHPIQAGSIDGTDIVPHDNAISRALLCSSASLYDPFCDSKVIGDPYCTVFVGRLSHFTTEDSLSKAMSKYGHIKNLRLVRHIVTGESCGYAFVEYENERDMRRAFKDGHHTIVDDHEIMVDYCRQLLMPGWIPRRLGGGLGGKKESGQLRFGGRERPFRAPLQQVPHESLKSLGIPLPPEGRYMSRFEVPSPPRRKRGFIDAKVVLNESINTEKPENSRRSISVEDHHCRSREYSENDCHRYRSKDRERRRTNSSGDDEYYANGGKYYREKHQHRRHHEDGKGKHGDDESYGRKKWHDDDDGRGKRRYRDDGYYDRKKRYDDDNDRHRSHRENEYSKSRKRKYRNDDSERWQMS